LTKKILVVCNFRHASPRIPGLLNTLADLGWEIHVLCPPLPENANTELGFPPRFLEKISIHAIGEDVDLLENLRRLLSRFGYSDKKSFLEQLKSSSSNNFFRDFVNRSFTVLMSLFAFPDLERKWTKSAAELGKELSKSNTFDFILSSSPFPTSHVIANRISKFSNSKWVADYRDPWCSNPVYPYGQFRRFFEVRYEKKVIRQATIITTVSTAYANLLGQIHGKEIFVIPNGFIDYGYVRNSQERIGKLVFVHTGNIYEGNHKLEVLFEALQILNNREKLSDQMIQVLFYGRYEVLIQDLIKKFDMERIVFQMGHAPRLQCVRIQSEADGLLFFNWENQVEKGLSHLKFYEYIASGSKIIVIGASENEYTEIIQRYNFGELFTTSLELADGILNIRKFQSVSHSKNELKEFGYAHQAKKLNIILDNYL